MFKNKKKTIVVCIAMFFVTLFLSLSIAFQESFFKKYYLVNIEECNIPVPSTFNLVRLRDSFVYLAFKDESLWGLLYIETKEENVSKRIKSLETFGFHIKSDTQRDGFRVIHATTEGPYPAEEVYEIFGEKYTIEYTPLNEHDLNYFFEVCNETRKH